MRAISPFASTSPGPVRAQGLGIRGWGLGARSIPD